MSDYTKIVTYGNKTSSDTIDGTEFDAEFSAYAVASATKMDKVQSPTAGNYATLDGNGQVEDSGDAALGAGAYLALITPEEFANYSLSPTSPSWTTVTCSTANSAGASHVRCMFEFSQTQAGDSGSGGVLRVYARKTNSADPISFYNQIIQSTHPRDTSAATRVGNGEFTVPVDSSGRFDLYIEGTLTMTTNVFSVTLLGYIK